MLLEAVIALLLSVLFLAVFTAPAWLLKLGSFGGLAFVIYVMILGVEWLFNTLKKPKTP